MNEILKEIVILLCEIKWEFEIINLLGVSEDRSFISAINPEEIGRDILAIYTYEGKEEWVITETESERLADLYKFLKETDEKGYSETTIRKSKWLEEKEITFEKAREVMQHIESLDVYNQEIQEELKLIARFIYQQEKKENKNEQTSNNV